MDLETFRLDSETFPVVFGNLCIRKLVFGNFSGWIRKLFRLYSATCVFGNLYSETFPVGFGNFSGWIRKLSRLESEIFPGGFGNLYSKTFPDGFGNFPAGFGNFSGCIRQPVYSETCIRKLFRLDSETFPVGFGNFPVWSRKSFRVDSETCIPKLFRMDSETFLGGFGSLYSETLSTE